MDLNEFDLLYRIRVNVPGVTGSTIRLPLDQVPPGIIRVVTHLTIENKTHSYTKCRLTIYNGGTDIAIDEADYPQKNELLMHKQHITLGEGDQLRASCTGTTTGDDLELIAIGREKSRPR